MLETKDKATETVVKATYDACWRIVRRGGQIGPPGCGACSDCPHETSCILIKRVIAVQPFVSLVFGSRFLRAVQHNARLFEAGDPRFGIARPGQPGLTSS